MNKNFKRFIQSALALALAVAPLSACNKKPVNYVESGVTVTFNFNDSTGGKGGSRDYKVVVQDGEQVKSPSTPQREGYTFKGWATAQTGGEEVTLPNTPKQDTTYYAQWEVQKCMVVFDYNFDGSKQKVEKEYTYGSTVESLQVAESEYKQGHSFLNWKLGTSAESSDVTFPYVVKGNTTFYAYWVAGAIFTVTLNNNYDGAETKEVKVPNGSNLTLEQAAKPSRSGYEFVGWGTTSNAAADSVVTLPYKPTENTTLYAIWKKAKVKVNFAYNYVDSKDANGVATKNFIVKECEAGDAIQESDISTPTREGYTFEGWYTNNVGGEKIQFPYTASKTTAVFAHWKSNAVKTTKFDAEFTYIDPQLVGPGYSGAATGLGILQADNFKAEIPAANRPKSEAYPLNSKKPNNVGHYLFCLYAKGITVTFEIYSDKAVSNAKLKLRLAYEILTGGSLVIGPNGDSDSTHQYQVKVNGSALDYAPITIVGVDASAGGMFMSTFDDYEISVPVSLKEGKNVIELVTDNSDTQFGGTTNAVAPMVDRIEFVESSLDGAQLYWHPIYDNIY